MENHMTFSGFKKGNDFVVLILFIFFIKGVHACKHFKSNILHVFQHSFISAFQRGPH